MEKKTRKKRATISDIARETGFSIATVSRVINNTNTSYSQETKRKVEAAVNRLNYKPDMIARSLKERRSYNVALLTPQIDEFYASMYNSMNTIAIEKGYSLTWLGSQYDPSTQERNLAIIKDRDYDGVIVATGLLGKVQDVREFVGDVPVVMIEGSSTIEGVSRVYVDVERLCRDAVQHLVDNGHRSIAYISAPLQFDTLRDRYQGYCEGLKRNNLPLDPSIVYFDEELTRSSYEGSYQLMRRVLADRRFSAMLVISDWAAFTAIKAAKEMHLQVPRDLSIVGFDNLPFTNFSEPPLTTVSQDQEALGKNAMKMMLELIDKKPPRVVRLEGEVVYRYSVAPRA